LNGQSRVYIYDCVRCSPHGFIYYIWRSVGVEFRGYDLLTVRLVCTITLNKGNAMLVPETKRTSQSIVDVFVSNNIFTI
jgi:hypothetical protein